MVVKIKKQFDINKGQSNTPSAFESIFEVLDYWSKKFEKKRQTGKNLEIYIGFSHRNKKVLVIQDGTSAILYEGSE